MRRPPYNRSWLFGVVVLAGILLLSLPARAQSIKVTSAVPDTTEQGNLGLVVTVAGENFGKSSKVAYFVTGTTNPGGITVKGVKFINSKTLETTIDVAPDAQTDLKFDIQVMSNGRTGKGTELFKVLVKQNSDLPPGSVMDLHTVDVGFNSAVFQWTAPADDGYDPASGPATGWSFRIRGGDGIPGCGPFTADTWYPYAASDPCYVGSNGAFASAPDATETALVVQLAPNTQYYAMVRTQDDHAPDGIWSEIDNDLAHQVSFTTGPFPVTPWTAGIVDVCRPPEDCYYRTYTLPSYMHKPRFDFDRDGYPALLYEKDGIYKLATSTGSGWQIETVGSLAGDLAFDPANGDATMASYLPSAPGQKAGLVFYRRNGATSDPWKAESVARGTAKAQVLRFNPVGSVPTILYWAPGSGQQTGPLRLAERRNATWTVQEIASGVGAGGGLAFDAVGNPTVIFYQYIDGRPVLGFGLYQGGSWKLEVADYGPGASDSLEGGITVAYDPGRGDFSAACGFTDTTRRHRHERFCERTAGVWTCETIGESESHASSSLAIGPDGTVFLAYFEPFPKLVVGIRPPGGSWTREFPDWNISLVANPILRLGADGQPGVAYGGGHGESGVGAYQPVCFARRSPPSP